MALSKKDYVFVRSDNADDAAKPPSLYRVLKVNGSEFHGRLEKDYPIRSVTATIPNDLIVANLGPKPHAGKVYGFDLHERYLKSIETEYGILHFYNNPGAERVESLVDGFERVGRRLSKIGLGALYDRSVAFEVRRKAGKYAGMFKPSRNPDENPHRIHFYTEVPSESFDYVIAHELGHLFQHEVLDEYPRLISQWQRLFDRTSLPVEVSKADSDKFLKHWISLQAGSDIVTVKAALNDLDEEQRPAMRAVVQWVQHNRGVRAHEMDVLMATENHEELQLLWPNRTIYAKRELKPLVSDYACRQMPELIAESFALALIGKKIPKAALALLDKSLSVGRKHLK